MTAREKALRESDAPTPLTDANEVDLHECISVQTISDGRRQYVRKYVPSYFARRLERRCQELEAGLTRIVDWSNETRRDYAMTALVEINNIARALLENKHGS